jgi:hypothetical protein
MANKTKKSKKYDEMEKTLSDGTVLKHKKTGASLMVKMKKKKGCK